MHLFRDTWVMAKRSLLHTIRSVDTIITVAAMPIAMMLLFVYVFGGSFSPGSGKYINFVVPGAVIMCVSSGIAYAALRLNMDLQKGIINRFRCMPIASSSILGGHAVSSVVSNLVSSALVMMVAAVAGFRSHASIAAWLAYVGLLLLFTLATTWLAIVFGLLAKTVEGSGAFSYILLMLVFISPAFTPTGNMNHVVRAFANNQPMTSIVETMRSLLIDGSAGAKAWQAVAWCVVLLLASYLFALRIYRSKAV